MVGRFLYDATAEGVAPDQLAALRELCSRGTKNPGGNFNLPREMEYSKRAIMSLRNLESVVDQNGRAR